MKQYFDKISKDGKCYFFLALIKSRSMATIRGNLSIRTLKNIESNNHIVKSHTAAFTSIGKKTRSWDYNVARCVLAESTVSRSTRQCCLHKCT